MGAPLTFPHTILVVDLAYGDCGKGTVVDYLTRRFAAHTVVRFNGGPQAAHNVVTPDGRHHTFSQFASGSFVPGVRTLLSRFVLVEPYALLNEARHLRDVGVPDALGRLWVDARCALITPCHQAANRLRELARGPAAHGTCGMGVGETMQDLIDRPGSVLRAGQLADRAMVARRLRAVRDAKLDQLREVVAEFRAHPRGRFAADTLLDPSWIDAAVDNYAALAHVAQIVDEHAVAGLLHGPDAVVFEGAQGVLLDEWFGFHPHTTWSTTTFANADAVLDEAGFTGRRTRLGVLRTYFTRHGPGPLVTEEPAMSARCPEPYNDDAGWQGRFRVGPFDTVAARYALKVAGPVDCLAITHLDRLSRLPPRVCAAYEMDAPRRRMADLPVRRPADLAHQERLTGMLGRCRPVYTSAPTQNAAAFLDLIRGDLGTPIGLTSAGPTATEKRLLDDGWLGRRSGRASVAVR
jgi:adenylosuccinate synthase